MDQLRASIKAMYHNYPIENAYGMIVGTDSSKGFLSLFARLACRENSSFTLRGMEACKGDLLRELAGRGFRKDNDIVLFAGLPLLFAEKVLTTDDKGYPRVQFQHLLRWREVVKCISEDLFTTSYLAQTDEKVRRDFFWSNVIAHDKEEINAFLDKGVSDIHAHFGGAIDSFLFNWICLMNDVGGLYDKFETAAMAFSFNRPNVHDKPYDFGNMASWCRVAAGIRVCLYMVLVKGQRFRKEVVKKGLKAIAESGSEELTRLMGAIDTLRTEAKQTRDGAILDYAIGEDLITDDFAKSPFCIYAGERQIEYLFYRTYLRTPSALNGTQAELFYLYELIKTCIRREFVCANEFAGLDNYIGFSSRAELFSSHIHAVYNTSAIQTSIRQNIDDYLETRVTSKTLELTEGEYWKGLYTKEPFLEKQEMRKRLTFVVQLTKSGVGKGEHRGGRYFKKRNEVHYEYNRVANYIASKQSAYDIVGMDVGGMELFYRPEVFAHALRSAKKRGYAITYHVGEEFYDIVDGIRAIWEVIVYTDSHPIDRLGHCIALAVTPMVYYKKHATLTMPRQVMLDNVVWLCCFAKRKGIWIKSSLKKQLHAWADELYKEIGYEKYAEALNMDDYYDSMLLRSDEANGDDGLDCWSVTAVLDTDAANKARNNSGAVILNEAYRQDESMIKTGEVMTSTDIDKDYVKLVGKIQKKMIDWVNGTGICIEACPSSNLQICNLERYDCHPAIGYYLNPAVRSFWPFCRRPKLNLAVCTDDKGTFSTSLVNEFSLLALAATKKFGWKKGVKKQFKQLVTQGKKYRFIR